MTILKRAAQMTMLVLVCLMATTPLAAAHRTIFRGDFKEALDGGFLYRTPLTKKILWQRALTRTDALKMLYKITRYLNLKIPQKYVKSIENSVDPKVINRGYRSFSTYLEGKYSMGSLLQKNYPTQRDYYQALIKLCEGVSRQKRLTIFKKSETSLPSRSRALELSTWHPKKRRISLKEAGLLALKVAKRLKHEITFGLLLKKSGVNNIFYLDVDLENPFYEEIARLHENRILGERYSRKYSLMLNDLISRNELIQLFGNLIRSNGFLEKREPARNQKKLHRSYWNPSIKRMIENGLANRLTQADKNGETKVSREELILTAETVFRFCELALGFDISPVKADHSYSDINKKTRLYKAVNSLLKRNIRPVKGRKLHKNWAVTRFEILDLISQYLKNSQS